MKSTYLAVYLVFTLVSAIFSRNIPTINLYYESMCPGCEEFIGGTFKDFISLEGHEKIATVNFFPYGNAKESLIDQKWQFSCQHGEQECQGNLIESCASRKLSTEDFQQFLVCVKENIDSLQNDFVKAAETCVTDAAKLQSITDCYSSDEGNQIEHEMAEATDSLNPKHYYVPWFTVDGVYSYWTSWKIQNNFVYWICSNYSDIAQVKEVCDKRKATEPSSKYNEEVDQSMICLNHGALKFLH